MGRSDIDLVDCVDTEQLLQRRDVIRCHHVYSGRQQMALLQGLFKGLLNTNNLGLRVLSKNRECYPGLFIIDGKVILASYFIVSQELAGMG